MDNTYLFIGGPASGKRLRLHASRGGEPPMQRTVRAYPPNVPFARLDQVPVLPSTSRYNCHCFTLGDQKRYIYVWEGMGAVEAFDLLVERFPK